MESSITALLSPIRQSAAYLKSGSKLSTPWYKKVADSRNTPSSLGDLVKNGSPLRKYFFGRSRSDSSFKDIEDLKSQIVDLQARLKDSDPANNAEQVSIRTSQWRQRD